MPPTDRPSPHAAEADSSTIGDGFYAWIEGLDLNDEYNLSAAFRAGAKWAAANAPAPPQQQAPPPGTSGVTGEELRRLRELEPPGSGQWKAKRRVGSGWIDLLITPDGREVTLEWKNDVPDPSREPGPLATYISTLLNAAPRLIAAAEELARVRADAAEYVSATDAQMDELATRIEALEAERDAAAEGRVVEDGLGNAWSKCDRHDCGLLVVRPGKADCDHDGCTSRAATPAVPQGEPIPARLPDRDRRTAMASTEGTGGVGQPLAVADLAAAAGAPGDATGTSGVTGEELRRLREGLAKWRESGIFSASWFYDVVSPHIDALIAAAEGRAAAEAERTILQLHRRFHAKVGCAGPGACYVCGAEEALAAAGPKEESIQPETTNRDWTRASPGPVAQPPEDPVQPGHSYGQAATEKDSKERLERARRKAPERKPGETGVGREKARDDEADDRPADEGSHG